MYADIHQSPTYEISYMICILAGYSIAYIISTFTSFFLCAICYVCACFKDIRNMIAYMDDDRYGKVIVWKRFGKMNEWSF